jgi:hypothetical protein
MPLSCFFGRRTPALKKKAQFKNLQFSRSNLSTVIKYQQLIPVSTKRQNEIHHAKTLATKGKMKFSANCLRNGIHPANWFSSMSIQSL